MENLTFSQRSFPVDGVVIVMKCHFTATSLDDFAHNFGKYLIKTDRQAVVHSFRICLTELGWNFGRLSCISTGMQS